MDRYKDNFTDKIAEICISKFNSLGKNGKPKENTEWTLLACFVKEDHSTETLEVVALGTGSKCVGAQHLSSKGDLLHDSHAEVIARRAFKVYLLDQMNKTKDGQLSIFEEKEDKYKLKSSISFHLYSSHTPCGDASIFPKQEWQEECSGENIESINRKYLFSSIGAPNMENDNSQNSRIHLPADIFNEHPPGMDIKTEEVSGSVSENNRVGNATDVGSIEKVQDVLQDKPPLKKMKIEAANLSVYEVREKSALTISQDVSKQELLNKDVVKEGITVCLVKEGRNGNETTITNDTDSCCMENPIGTSQCWWTDTVKNCNQATVLKTSHVPSVEEADIHRTGAKCVSGEKSDPKLPGSDYHVTGVLRTKPGRGNPTLSLSCSDKIFKWTVLGVQGSLLMLLLDAPIYIETIIIGQCPFSQEAMERALYGRFEKRLQDIHLPSGFQIVTPVILHSTIDFPFSRICVSKNASNPSKVKPSSTSLIWSSSDTHKNKHEVATKGRKLGSTELNSNKPSSWVSICRKVILRQVVSLLERHISLIGDKNLCLLSYEQLQCQARYYSQAWENLKMNVLMNWTIKPKHMKDFTSEIMLPDDTTGK